MDREIKSSLCFSCQAVNYKWQVPIMEFALEIVMVGLKSSIISGSPANTISCHLRVQKVPFCKWMCFCTLSGYIYLIKPHIDSTLPISMTDSNKRRERILISLLMPEENSFGEMRRDKKKKCSLMHVHKRRKTRSTKHLTVFIYYPTNWRCHSKLIFIFILG